MRMRILLAASLLLASVSVTPALADPPARCSLSPASREAERATPSRNASQAFLFTEQTATSEVILLSPTAGFDTVTAAPLAASLSVIAATPGPTAPMPRHSPAAGRSDSQVPLAVDCQVDGRSSTTRITQPPQHLTSQERLSRRVE